MRELVLGSHNEKKLHELKALLREMHVRVRSLAEFPHSLHVEETGSTFRENARLKAIEQARYLKCWVLAEDSGLTVPALRNQPGVYSARYAGHGATDAANNRKLIGEIQALPESQREAYYTCQLCLAAPDGEILFETTAEFHGRITDQPAGEYGFGYDPLFWVPEYHRTVAQLGPASKSAIGHRGRAMRLFCRFMMSQNQSR